LALRHTVVLDGENRTDNYEIRYECQTVGRIYHPRRGQGGRFGAARRRPEEARERYRAPLDATRLLLQEAKCKIEWWSAWFGELIP